MDQMGCLSIYVELNISKEIIVPKKLSIYLLEVAEISGTKLSCLTTRLRDKGRKNHLLLHNGKFKDEHEFQQELLKIFKKIFNNSNEQKPQDQIHLLIISAHGKPRTGTELCISGEKSFDLTQYSDYFKIFPDNMFVYISACWGAYPLIIEAIRSKSDNPPILIGPLIPIDQSQNIQIQNSIIDCLCCGDCNYEKSLIQVVESLNKSKYLSYYDQLAVRIVTKNGNMIPGSEAVSLSAKVEERKKYLIVSIQSTSTSIKYSDSNFFRVILYDGESFWMTYKHELSLDEKFKIKNPYLAINKAIEVKCKIYKKPTSLNIGTLTEIIKIERLHKVPDKLKNYEPPYSYCVDEPISNKIYFNKNGIKKESPCLSCNWAILEPTNIIENDKINLVIDISCRRKKCAVHSVQ